MSALLIVCTRVVRKVRGQHSNMISMFRKKIHLIPLWNTLEHIIPRQTCIYLIQLHTKCCMTLVDEAMYTLTVEVVGSSPINGHLLFP